MEKRFWQGAFWWAETVKRKGFPLGEKKRAKMVKDVGFFMVSISQ
jgi:hypothetical protein